MSKTFEIEGLEELLKSFAELGPEAMKQLREPSKQGAELVLGRARTKIRNRSGDLASSLKVSAPKKSKNPYLTVAMVKFSKNGAHGVPLELGHRLWYFGKKTNRDVEEKPFLRPAADESKDEVRDIIAGAMNKILKEWGE